MGGDGGYRWSGWPYGRDYGGPYGPGWTMGDALSKLVGALAGQAIITYAANAATGNIHATAAALPPLI